MVQMEENAPKQSSPQKNKQENTNSRKWKKYLNTSKDVLFYVKNLAVMIHL